MFAAPTESSRSSSARLAESLHSTDNKRPSGLGPTCVIRQARAFSARHKCLHAPDLPKWEGRSVQGGRVGTLHGARRGAPPANHC